MFISRVENVSINICYNKVFIALMDEVKHIICCEILLVFH